MFETLIVAVITALGKLALDYFQRQKATKEAVQDGRDAKGAEINKETADAERRASAAASNTPDIDGMLADMDKGKF